VESHSALTQLTRNFTPHERLVILTQFLKIAMVHAVLDIYCKTTLEKSFFFILCYFYLLWFSCRKNWKMALLRGEIFSEIGHIEYRKIKNFMLI
jgi:hypothetical protein